MKHSAGVILYRQNPFRILLVLPSGNFKPIWGIPKGEIEVAESKAEAAVREIKEELGLDLLSNDLTFFESVIYPNRRKAVHAFVAPFPENQEIVLNWENSKAEWFSLEEAESIILPGQRPLIEKLRAYVKR